MKNKGMKNITKKILIIVMSITATVTLAFSSIHNDNKLSAKVICESTAIDQLTIGYKEYNEMLPLF